MLQVILDRTLLCVKARYIRWANIAKIDLEAFIIPLGQRKALGQNTAYVQCTALGGMVAIG